MMLPRLLIFTALLLFSTIGLLAAFKKGQNQELKNSSFPHAPIEIKIDQNNAPISIVPSAPPSSSETPSSLAKNTIESTPIPPSKPEKTFKPIERELPDANRIEEFFNINGPQFPCVETITYKSRVSWQKGRPAWLSDYANHYKTSRHFIARSLNGKPDYLKQELAEGNRFNILKPGKNIQFHLIIDTSRCKLWFYYHDLDNQEKVLVKTYTVGLGRIDQSKISGLLTPLGIYSLGSRTAVYNPKVMGMHRGEKIEMIQVFGTRWIPFEKEIKGTTSPAKGFGIHGMPWIVKNGTLVEDIKSLGQYESDGCIRMTANDIEEIYAIVISRPTTVEIVKDFFDSENKIQSISTSEK